MVWISDFSFLGDPFSPRRHGHLTSSEVTSCNGNMRRHLNKCAISSKRADIEFYYIPSYEI